VIKQFDNISAVCDLLLGKDNDNSYLSDALGKDLHKGPHFWINAIQKPK
jgi:hypothetical protein